jgi:hypothetical protein
MHLHLNFAEIVAAFFGWLLIWIPVKMLAANFVGRSNVADTVFGIL